MADKKISALPAATTPLAGTEVLPIVQGGTTDQVSVANLTAGRAVNALSVTMPNTEGATSFTGSGATIGRGTAFLAGQAEIYTAGTRPLGIGTTGAGNLNFYTGSTRAFYIDTNQNFVVQTAGKGIDFSATPNAPGMTSELLNDYEEGTWTTTVSGVSNFTGTPTLASGKYTRVGRLITIEGKFSGTVTTGLINAYFEFTLPIARGAGTDGGAGSVISNANFKLGGIYNASANTTTAYLVMSSSSGQPSGADTFFFSYSYYA